MASLAGASFSVRGEDVIAMNTEDGDDDYETVKSLYDEAHRSILGWDDAVSEIEKELSKEGSVGVPEPEYKPRPTGPPDDEIPF